MSEKSVRRSLAWNWSSSAWNFLIFNLPALCDLHWNGSWISIFICEHLTYTWHFLWNKKIHIRNPRSKFNFFTMTISRLFWSIRFRQSNGYPEYVELCYEPTTRLRVILSINFKKVPGWTEKPRKNTQKRENL